MSVEDTIERAKFDEVRIIPRRDMRCGVKESVDLAAGYLINALTYQEIADEQSSLGGQIVAVEYEKRSEDVQKHAETIARVLNTNFPSPDVDDWFSVIRTTAVEFLEAL